VTPVLLTGHSHGGAVVTEAGNNPKVAGDGFLVLTPKGVVEDFAPDLTTEHGEYFTGVESEKVRPPGPSPDLPRAAPPVR
jgi:hypothetical protein